LSKNLSNNFIRFGEAFCSRAGYRTTRRPPPSDPRKQLKKLQHLVKARHRRQELGVLAILMALMSSPNPAAASERLPWITPMDYPAALAASRPQGIVQVRLTFGGNGRVTGCEILKSSRSSILDSTTCALSQRRGRAKAGAPRVQVLSHRWTAPAPR
jgi:protein TonB